MHFKRFWKVIAVSATIFAAVGSAVVAIVVDDGQPRFAALGPERLDASPTVQPDTGKASTSNRPAKASATEDSKRLGIVPGRIVVRFKASATKAERAAARRAIGGKLNKKLPLDAEVLDLPKGVKVATARKKLESQPAVKYAQPDHFTYASATVPNDEFFSQQWALRNTGQNGGRDGSDMDATTAWDTSTGGEDVVIAVIDSGIDYEHPDMAANMWFNQLDPENGIDDDNNGLADDWRGWDYVNEDNNPIDDNKHGTHVAGIAAAAGNNGVGISGVAWNAKLMNLKTQGSTGVGFSSDAEAAMAYAGEHGAQVVNASLGHNSTTMNQYTADLIASYPNTLYVFAAGNDNIDSDGPLKSYPCSYPASNIICVASTNSSDVKSSDSTYGATTVDLAAPGVDILSTKAAAYTSAPGQYLSLSGTSMATPQVAGAAAVLFAAQPTATTEEVREAILAGVDRIPSLDGKVASGGRLNLQGAIAALDIALNPPVAKAHVTSSGELVFRNAGPENDQIVATASSTTVDIEATGVSITAGAGCFSAESSRVRCDRTRIDSVTLATGDGDDSVQADIDLDSTVDLGAGDDSAVTGSGDDTILGGPGSDTLVGGAGSDAVDYSDRSENLMISMDGQSNDGAAGELDDLDVSIENATGGAGSDVMAAGTEPVIFDGGPGDDTLTGSDGDDELADGPGEDTIHGGLGNDRIKVTAGDGADQLDAGEGVDVVDYSDTPTGKQATVKLDGLPNDGYQGAEGDNVGDAFENVVGSFGNDAIYGTEEANELDGAAGFDSIYGGGGDDTLRGGGNSDNLDGGLGNDLISGGDANDTVSYTSRTVGVDVTFDETANDGEPGEQDNALDDVEIFSGGSGDDHFVGNGENNYIYGNAGADTLDGGAGTDSFYSGPGADTFVGGDDDNFADIVDYGSESEPVFVTIDGQGNDGRASEGDNVGLDIEIVRGGYGDDEITGGEDDDRLYGGNGNDTLSGAGGDDTLHDDPGSDTFIGGPGTDLADFGGATTDLNVSLDGERNDGTAGALDLVEGSIEAVSGGQGDDSLTGDAQNNRIYGASGSDTIHGGDGDDLIGGGGSNGDTDYLYGESGNDQVAGGSSSYVSSGSYVNTSSFHGTSEIHGGTGNDKLTASADGSEIYGEDGNDLLTSSFGQDEISGGDGIDTATYQYTYGPVDISLDGQANDGQAGELDRLDTDIENLVGSWGDDTISGDEGLNKLRGSNGDDTISGLGGNDVLSGDGDIDILSGGDGDDFLASLDGLNGDTNNCGAGTDSINRDSADVTAADCEQSGFVGRVGIEHRFANSDILDFQASAGFSNNVTVAYSGTTFTITDAGGALEAGEDCDQIDVNTVACQDPRRNVQSVHAAAADGNDTIDIDASVVQQTRLDGGSGNDVLLGGSGTDYLTGSAGADVLSGRGGYDNADYSEVSTFANLSANDLADDGGINEGDNISSDIEQILGGSGNDTMHGSVAGTTLYGGEGNDTFVSGLGDDEFIGQAGTDIANYSGRTDPVQISQANGNSLLFMFGSAKEAARSGRVGEYDSVSSDIERFRGGSAVDSIRCPLQTVVAVDGGLGADEISECQTVDYSFRSTAVSVTFDGYANDGAPGEGDVLHEGVVNATGGSAADYFSGDAQKNTFTGNGGNDQFLVADESVDTVNCGTGTDTVTSDSRDFISSDCDSVDSASAVYRVNDELIFSTSGSESNVVEVSGGGNEVIVSDTAKPLTPGYGCDVVTTNSVSCSRVGISRIAIDTMDGGDTVSNTTTLGAYVQSGSGNDTIIAGNGSDIIDGGTGTDTVSYANHLAPVQVTLDNYVGDGSVGESDNVKSTVENIVGSAHGDTLTGSSAANSIDGAGGDDTIYAADGSTDTIFCAGGNDTAYLDGRDGEDGQCESVVRQSAFVYAGTLYVLGQMGAANNVVVSKSGATFVIDDTSGLTNPGNGCLSVTATQFVCDAGAVTAVLIDGLDGDDYLQAMQSVDVPVTFFGGNGTDTVSYSDHNQALNLNIDGSANDGANLERDNIATTVENLIGGSANDQLYGGSANNLLEGGPGADFYLGRAGVDTVTYETRTADLDVAIADGPNDGEAGENDDVRFDIEVVIGGSGNDRIVWGGGTGSGYDTDHVLIGNAGNDVINAGDGEDTVDAGDGDDEVFSLDYYNDSITCGLGSDEITPDGYDTFGADCEIVQSPTYVTYAPDPSAGELTIDSSSLNVMNDISVFKLGDDFIVHDALQPVVDAYESCSRIDLGTIACPDIDLVNMYVHDGAGNDKYAFDASVNKPVTFYDYLGSDEYAGGSGADRLYSDEEDVSDDFTGGSGTDTIDYAAKATAVNITLDGEDDDGTAGEHDNIGADVDSVVASRYDDTIVATDGPNSLNGGLGNDTFVGKLGADNFIGGTGNDLVDNAGRTEDLTIVQENTANDGAVGEGDNVRSDIERVHGGNGNDSILSTTAANQLKGGPGNDTLNGANGNDFLDGETGSDTLVGGSGTDTTSYADRQAAVEVSIDGNANDGEAGEGDFVQSGIEVVIGGEAGDTLSADGQASAVNFQGSGGNDQIVGGPGSDFLDGGDGDDLVTNGGGSDLVYAGDGNDAVTDTGGYDTIYAGLGSDSLVSEDGGDSLNGGEEDDSIVVNGWSGATIDGEGGDDTMVGGLSGDEFIGGTGNDTVDYRTRAESGVVVAIDNEANDGALGEGDDVRDDIETVYGDSGPDQFLSGLVGPSFVTFWGGDGDDMLMALDGAATLHGEAGDDYLGSGPANETFFGGPGMDIADYGSHLAGVSVTLDGQANDGEPGQSDNVGEDVETIYGTAQSDHLEGGPNAVSLVGWDGDDELIGGDGDDSLSGVAGSDSIEGGAGLDTVNYDWSGSGVTVVLGGSSQNGEPGENDTIGSDVENAIGSGADDTIVGDSGANLLMGGSGNDSVTGLGGSDLLQGEAGDDSLAARDGIADTVICGDGTVDSADVDTIDLATDCEQVIGAPETTVTAGPTDGSYVLNQTTEFEFASDQPSSQFECRIDEQPWTACSSPHTTNTLAEGERSFQVRAKDAFGNFDASPATRSFTVDTMSASLTITAPAGVVTTVNPQIRFTASDASGIASQTCSIDNSAFSGCVDGSIWGTDLGQGAHTLRVRVVDNAGNIVTAPQQFVVDTQGPGTEITAPSAGELLDSNTVAVEWTDDGTAAQSTCSLNGSEPVACSTGHQFTAAEGTHAATIRQLDPYGNESIDSVDFTIDTTAPSLSVTAPSGIISTSTPQINYSATDPNGIVQRECKIDAADYSGCPDGAIWATPLSEGAHTVYVRVTDGAGNATVDSRPFTVDTQGPSFALTAPTGTVNDSTPQIDFTASDANGIVLRICSIDGGSPVTCVNGMQWATPLADGPHSIWIGVQDGAGNFSSGAFEFTVDTVLPDTVIDPTPPAAFTNQTSASFDFHSTEPSSTFECQIDDGGYSPCTSPKAYSGLAANTAHTFNVRATDAALNTDTSPATHTWTIDTINPAVSITAPAASSVTADTTPLANFSVSDTNAGPGANTTCQVTGATSVAQYTCTPGADLPSLNNGTNTLTVRHTDLAGNTGSSTVNFDVDTTAPAISITAPANGSSTQDTTPPLAFTLSEAHPGPVANTTCQVSGATTIAQFVCSSGTDLPALNPGSNTLTVRHTDAVGNLGTSASTFTILNPPILTATPVTPPSGTHSLNNEGLLDWSHWGTSNASSWDHSATGGARISNVTAAGSTTFTRYTSSVAPTVSWSGGTPTASSSGTATGIGNTTSAVNNGFQFTVGNMQNNETLTLRLHAGVMNCQGKLELWWSSNPGSIVTDTSLSGTSTTTAVNGIYHINLRAPQANDTLNVRWRQNTVRSTSSSRVRIYSASLAPVAVERADAPTSSTLSTEGAPLANLDWTHWGGVGTTLPASPLTPIGKSGATQISNATQEGSGTISLATATTLPVVTNYSWTGGDTTPTASNIRTGIANTGGAANRGFSFTVPAATSAKKLKLYVGATNTSSTAAQPVKLELYWGTNTIPVYTSLVPSFASATRNYVYTIDLRHVTAGTNLKVKWSTNSTSSSHRANIQSAVLLQN